MTYQEEERSRLRRQSTKQAIALAVQGRWQEAIAVNKNLLESFPNDVDACNRLGRAYMELGEYSQARDAYEKASELDPYNNIAQKNLDRLTRLNEPSANLKPGVHRVEPQQFIEEVGKSGTVNLLRLAPAQVLAKTVAGEKVNLKTNGANLIVENLDGEYLGQVDPRYGNRLIKLLAGGNRYSAAIISSKEDAVTVIIREVYQDPGQAGQHSFVPKGEEGSIPLASDRIIRREIEYEESLQGDASYTVIGGKEGEVFSEQSPDFEDETEDDE